MHSYSQFWIVQTEQDAFSDSVLDPPKMPYPLHFFSSRDSGDDDTHTRLSFSLEIPVTLESELASLEQISFEMTSTSMENFSYSENQVYKLFQ